MGVALVPRRNQTHAGYVIPKGLRRRQKLKPIQKLWVYQEPIWFTTALTALGLSIWYTANNPSSALGITTTVLFSLSGIVSGLFWTDASETKSFKKRENAILQDRGRTSVPHAHERKSRKADVNYAQYSVKAFQDGTSVKFYLIEHTQPGRFWYWLKHEKTKKSFWEGDLVAAQLDNPTLESLQIELAKWYDVAAELERNSYQSALKKAEVQRLVLELN